MAGSDLRQSEIAVGVGLHVLRYASSGAGSAAPIVEIAADRRSASFIEFIEDPRSRARVLDGVGSVLVIRCSAEGGRLLLRVVPRVPGGSMDARIRLEPLGQPVENVAPAQELRSSREAAEAEFGVLGHVSRRGDVLVGPGEWLAGPSGPLPIEGIEIRGVPPSVGLECQVLFGGREPQWSAWVPAGRFAGSRGRGRSLLGVRMRLMGQEGFGLRAQALFLGAPVVSKFGRSVELIGRSASDPLVGLSVSLEGEKPAVGRVDPVVQAKHSVRVFRPGGF